MPRMLRVRLWCENEEPEGKSRTWCDFDQMMAVDGRCGCTDRNLTLAGLESIRTISSSSRPDRLRRVPMHHQNVSCVISSTQQILFDAIDDSDVQQGSATSFVRKYK
jgi:hypothetical protein